MPTSPQHVTIRRSWLPLAASGVLLATVMAILAVVSTTGFCS